MKKFNKDKYLRKLKIRRWLQSNSRSLYIGVSCLFVCIIGLYFAYSKFFVKQEIEVVRTTVGEFTTGDIVLNVYIDNEKVDAAPKKGAGYKFDQISCDNDAKGAWNSDTWNLLVNNLTKKTKCDVYFKKIVTKVPDIIATVDTTGKCPTVNDDGSVSVTAVEATNGYLCKAKDAYGDSYYYRGNVTNNYVKFGEWQVRKYFGYYSDTSNNYQMYDSLEECQNASYYNKKCAVGIDIGTPMYWRIVRINGDGTVRVIYDGTSAHANGESNKDRQIGTSVFNSNRNDNAYVGYMFGSANASSYEETHANINDSTVKAYIDNWYKTNIVGTTNEQYLADNVFCNDRSISSNKPSGYNNLGYGANLTAYRWYYGPWGSSGYNSSMRLMCPQKNDAFTVSDTTNGNGALTYPVGLLSIEEIVLAGGWHADNSGYYLYSGEWWWTFSPYNFDGGRAYVRRVYWDGYASLTEFANSTNGGVRPVFNLKAEVLAQGSGTASDPYRLSLNS